MINKKTYLLVPLLLFSLLIEGQTISGELKKWHKITLEFTDATTYTESGTPNPFLDRRLNVTFTSPSGNMYNVPGYFAADGNSAETSANSGNKWHVHIAPDEIGQWSYNTSFRQGSNIAVEYPANASSGTSGSFDGASGTFNVVATDKSGLDLRGKGRLQYVGERYLRFAENGEYFIKGGPDSPENFLAYNDFDDVYNAGTDYRKDYSAHIADWNTGDPQWQGNKGRGIIGVINYLSEKGMNTFSFLTMNRFLGDTRDVSMHLDNDATDVPDYERIDVSKTAQWEIVFSHADTKGMHLHFKTQEQENAAQLDDGGGNPNGFLGTERKLYYRELIARFGHHLALNWNMGEENNGAGTGTVASPERIAQLQYVADLDPYSHLRVVHSTNTDQGQAEIYDDLLGNSSELTGVSLQVQVNSRIHQRVKYWIDQSTNAGKPWPVSCDESGGGMSETIFARKDYLYGTLFAGGHGVEYYFQGQDFTIEDFRADNRDEIWDFTEHAINFFNTYLPFTEMESNDDLTSSTADFCFAKINEIYAVYRTGNASNNINIGNTGDSYSIMWYDARNGGALQTGTVATITADGSNKNFGSPPNTTSEDWIALIRNESSVSTASISIDNATVNEGESATLTVSLDANIGTAFTVDYNTANSSAVAGSDYTSNSGTLSFSGTLGETQTITVDTTDDTDIEGSEQFFVNLNNVSVGNVSISDSQGIITINDNDTATAQVSINNVTVIEGEEAVFEVSVDNAVSGGFTLDYTTEVDTASAADFTSTSGTLTFSGTVGEVQEIRVPTTDDVLVEALELFNVNLSNISSALVVFADNQGLGAIEDNDEVTDVSIDDVSVIEGETASFTVSSSAAVSGGFTVDYEVMADTATAGSDYTVVSGTLTFNGTVGEQQSIDVVTLDDTLVENAETFTVNLSNASSTLVNIQDGEGTGTIEDNDEVTDVSIGDVSVTEGETASFTVSSSTTVSGGFTIDYDVVADTATAGSDYTVISGTLTFTGTVGEQQLIDVVTLDDTLVENAETFTVNLSNASSTLVNIQDGEGIGTIEDNDATAQVSISNVTVIEGEEAVFEVSVDNAVTGGFTVDYTTEVGTATEADFTSQMGTLSFNGSENETQQIRIATTDDSLVELLEEFSVVISSSNTSLSFLQNTGVATITDNDAAPTITLEDATAVEGNSLNFRASIDEVYASDIVLTIGYENVTASNEDYNAESINITIPSGSTTSEFSVATFTDEEEEENEVFLVVIREVLEGVVANIDEIATGTIVNNILSMGDTDPNNIIVYPVPLKEGNTIIISDIANENFALRLYDVEGAQVLSKEVVIQNFFYELNIPLDVANGIYYINLKSLSNNSEFKEPIIIAR